MARSDAAAEEEADARDEDGDGGVLAGGEGGERDGGGRAEGGDRVEEAAGRGEGEVAAAQEDVSDEGQEEAAEVPACEMRGNWIRALFGYLSVMVSAVGPLFNLIDTGEVGIG